jgi:uncharacterized integral membrane protein
MNRNTIYALVIIALLMVVFIFNKGSVDVNLVAVRFSALKSLVFLGFTAVGVLVGVLLK